MPTYLIAYDKVGDTNYEPLWAALKQAGAHKALLSTWLLDSHLSSGAIFDKLRSYMDSDDRLLVTEIVASNTRSQSYKGTRDYIRVNA